MSHMKITVLCEGDMWGSKFICVSVLSSATCARSQNSSEFLRPSPKSRTLNLPKCH